MKINELAINNFGAIGRAVFALDDKGLVLVQGVNDDDSSASSNGAGKSTIPDALCWALYGITARGDSGDKVVNRTAGKDCIVSVSLSDATHAWQIVRYRKHSANKNRLVVTQIELASGGAIDLTCGTDKETQALVESILGCTHEVFAASIYAGQEAMRDLPALTDKQLKELIEEAAGITRLQRAHDVAREELRSATKALDEFATTAKVLVERVEAAKRLKGEADDGIAKWDVEHAGRIAGCSSALAVLTGECKRAEARAAGYPSDLDDQREALVKQLDGHKDERDALTRLEQVVRDAEKQVTKQNTLMASAASVLVEDKRNYENVDELLGKPCPECDRPHTAEDRDKLKAHIGKQLKARATSYKALKAELETLLAAQHAAEEAVAKHKSAMTDVSELAAKIKGLNETITQRDLAHKEADAAKEAIERAVRERDLVRGEANPFIALREKAETQLVAARAELERHQKEGAALEERLSLVQAAVEVFGPAGVRAHILDTVTPLLNARTAEYLNHLSDGNLSATWSTLGKTAKGELREKFNIEVASTTAGESFSSLSGGEKRKVRLACALALQDLVASRASKPIELFVGDEIDHALDPAGLERLMGVLEMKAKERGTVLVISHSDLTDWCKQTCVITKTGGYSTASGALVI